MKFTTFIPSFLLSLFLLLQPAQADISQKEAQEVLKAVKDLMAEEGIEKTFEIIKTHFASNSVSPDSRDQPPRVIDRMVQALGNSDAQVFCVKNSMLIASNRYPARANGHVNVVEIRDANGNQPFAQMIKKLKAVKQQSLAKSKEMNTTSVIVTNVFPHIINAENLQMLKTQHSILLAGRHELLESEADHNLDPEDKFFCGVDNIRP